MNIFFSKYSTPFEAIPFDRISLNDYEEAIMKGIEEEDKEVDAIVNNPDAPTFENTIIAFEKAGELMGKACDVFFNLLSCATTDEMDELSEKLSLSSRTMQRTLHSTRDCSREWNRCGKTTKANGAAN